MNNITTKILKMYGCRANVGHLQVFPSRTGLVQAVNALCHKSMLVTFTRLYLLSVIETVTKVIILLYVYY